MSRGTPTGRAMLDRKTIHVQDISAEIETEFPRSTEPQRLVALVPSLPRHCFEKVSRLELFDPPHRSPPFLRRTDCPSKNFRRPSRNRDRERAAVQRTSGAQRRITRGAGASDGDIGSAWHYQPVPNGLAAGAGRSCGKCRALMRGEGCSKSVGLKPISL